MQPAIDPAPVPPPAAQATAQAAAVPQVAGPPIQSLPAPVLYVPPYPALYALPAPPPMLFPASDQDDREGMETAMKAFGIPHGYRLAVSSSRKGLTTLQ